MGKKEVLPFVTACIDLDGIREARQTKPNTVWYHLYAESEKTKPMETKVEWWLPAGRRGSWKGFLKTKIRVLDAIHSFHKPFSAHTSKAPGNQRCKNQSLPSRSSGLVGARATLALWQLFAESTLGSEWAGKADMKARGCGVMGRGVRTAEDEQGTFTF